MMTCNCDLAPETSICEVCVEFPLALTPVRFGDIELSDEHRKLLDEYVKSGHHNAIKNVFQTLNTLMQLFERRRTGASPLMWNKLGPYDGIHFFLRQLTSRQRQKFLDVYFKLGDPLVTYTSRVRDPGSSASDAIVEVVSRALGIVVDDHLISIGAVPVPASRQPVFYKNGTSKSARWVVNECITDSFKETWPPVQGCAIDTCTV